ncbi:MAG: T9SS type A sorting domain-containing protein [Ignavibacteriaceae bacterium]
MKKLSILFMLLFLSASLFAQTYLDVQPGYGTLNDAITKNQGNVIYRLQAGGWYTLNGEIENDGFPLTIVGTQAAAGQMPATIQTATNADGTVLSTMFTVRGDISLKNLFIVNANTNNVVGNGIFLDNSPTSTRVALDSVTIDPVGGGSGGAWFIQFANTPRPKVFLTNSLFLRTGYHGSEFDGWFFYFNGGPTNNGFDTLYVENNTFMNLPLGWEIGASGLAAGDSSVFVWVNHNNFIFAKNWFLLSWGMMQYYVTNNLFVDYETFPCLKSWNSSFADADTSHDLSVICQDTMANDWQNGKLLSSRKLFVEYNSWYLDPRIQNIVTTWQYNNTKNNDGVTPLTPAQFFPLAYPADSAKVNLESGFWNNPSFPGFKFGNYFDNSGDPQFNDPKLYAFQDSLADWALPIAELYTWSFNSNNVNPLPSTRYNSYVCEDTTYNWGNPEVWPRVNASYKNPALLTASIEGLPLGDLNWFPDKKAIWENNKAEIMQHILSGDTSKIFITDVKQENGQKPTTFALSQNYPNPFNPSTVINYSISKSQLVTLKIYSILGQEVATLVNQEQSAGNYHVTFDASKLSSGIYFYTIKSGNVTLTKKMTLLK